MTRFEFTGPLEVFVQEGGYALHGISVDGEDIGEALMVDSREARTYSHARVVVETDDGGTDDPLPGFLRQVRSR